MGEVRDSRWYDAAFASEPNLTAPHGESTFGVLWLEMARRVPHGRNVFEAGCGAGQLAALVAPKSKAYVAADFSTVALDRVTTAIPKLRTVCVDLTTCSPPDHLDEVDLLLACEVFEHLEGDADLWLIRLCFEARLLASVPKNDSAGHVRWFPTRESVVERYSKDVDDLEVEEFGPWWIVSGVCA